MPPESAHEPEVSDFGYTHPPANFNFDTVADYNEAEVVDQLRAHALAEFQGKDHSTATVIMSQAGGRNCEFVHLVLPMVIVF